MGNAAVRSAREQLRSDDYRDRVRSIVMLGRWKDREALPHLADLLHDQDRRVRVEALHVLGELGVQSVVLRVIEAQGDREMSVRGAATGALRALGDHCAVEALIALLCDDSYGDLREAAILALAALASTDVRLRDPAIQELQRDSAYEVRCLAASLLTGFPEEEVIDVLIQQALSDLDQDVRAASALALGAIGARRAIPALEQMELSDKGEHWWPNHPLTVPIARTAHEAIQAILAHHAEHDRYDHEASHQANSGTT